MVRSTSTNALEPSVRSARASDTKEPAGMGRATSTCQLAWSGRPSARVRRKRRLRPGPWGAVPVALLGTLGSADQSVRVEVAQRPANVVGALLVRQQQRLS